MKNHTGWAGAILLAGFAAAVAVSWPGELSYDSIVQLLDARTGVYNTWHPPVMAWLMGLADAVVPGTGLFVVFDAALIFGALGSLLFLPRVRTGWAAVVVALLIVLSPQMVLYQGIVWKDVLFADAGVAGFVCLAQSAARWQTAGRWPWLGGGFVLLVLAGLARQNGLVLLPFAGIAMGWIAAREGTAARFAALLGGGIFVAALLSVFCINALLNLRSDGDDGPAEQIHVLQLYDLSGALAREPGLPLPNLSVDGAELAHALRTDGARLYTPLRNDPLMDSKSIEAALDQADDDALPADWRDLILHHTFLYLKVRATAFAYVFFTPDIAEARPVFTGIEGPADAMKTLGLKPRKDARDWKLEGYARAFMGTPVFWHPFFAAIAAIAIFVLLRRRRGADIAMAAMLFGSFAFVLSFFVISISCDYRYLYLLDLSAMAALFYLSLNTERAS